MMVFGFFLLIGVAVLSAIVLAKGSKFIEAIDKKYCNGISTDISTAEELKNKIIETNKDVVNNVIVNSSEQVEVNCESGTHTFYLENGNIKCDMIKYGFRISRVGRFKLWLQIVPKMKKANEINAIFEGLSGIAKTTEDNAKIIKDVSDKTKLTYIITIISMIVIIFSAVSSSQDKQTASGFDVYVDTIQSANLEYSEYTYKEIFNDFFTNPTWEHFTSTEGEDVVEFTGNCYYGEDKIAVLIQYLITYEDETSLEWVLNYFEIDGVAQDVATYDELITAAIEGYGESEISVDESKSILGILPRLGYMTMRHIHILTRNIFPQYTCMMIIHLSFTAISMKV